MTGLASTAKGAPRNARAVMASRDPDGDPVDFFPTPPWGARAGGELIKRLDPAARSVWEPACGPGHMVHGLGDYFSTVHASDAFLYDGNAIHDFVGGEPSNLSPDWVVTNPPFALAEAFIRQAYATARRGVAMLMRAAVLEGQGRFPLLYQHCPLTVFAPFSERLPMHKGRYTTDTSTAAFYAWFIWLKPELRPERFMARIGGERHAATVPIAPGSRQRLFRRSDLRFAVRAHALGLDAAGRTPSGDTLTEQKLLVLMRLAECGDRGATAAHGFMPGGTLAVLHQFGLAEHAQALDQLGGRRYRVNAAGVDLLTDLGLI